MFDVEHTEWLIRRVDTSELLDSIAGSSSIRTSLMIDGCVVTEILQRAGYSAPQSSYLPLPAQGKGLLGRFDVKMGDYSIPVVPRMDNAHVAVGIILVLVLGDVGAANDKVTGEVIDALYQLATCDPKSSAANALASVLTTVTGPKSVQDSSGEMVETDEIIGELPSALVDAPDDVLDLAIVVLDLIVAINRDRGAEHAVSITQLLDYYLKNFVPIGILDKLPASEFILKVQVSSNTFEPTPSEYLPRSNSSALRVLSRLAPSFIITFVTGALLLASNHIYGAALSIISIVVFIALSIGVWARLVMTRGFKWAIGVLAYESYLSSIQKLIPGLKLSGYYTLRCNDTNLGLRGSQHFRLSLPNGVRAVRLSVVDGSGAAVDVPFVESADWVAAHSDYQHRSPATLSVRVGVIPSTPTFLRHALYAAVVTMSLFGVGLVSHITGAALYDGCQTTDVVCPDYGLAHLVSRSSGAIVTVLAIAPSIYTIILLQREEHQFAATVYRVMRRVVGFCALASASVAIPLALDLPTTVVVVWWIFGLASSWFSCWHVAATRFYHGALSVTR
jgi:hypothetical protein